jgi:hypothetical protein
MSRNEIKKKQEQEKLKNYKDLEQYCQERGLFEDISSLKFIRAIEVLDKMTLKSAPLKVRVQLLTTIETDFLHEDGRFALTDEKITLWNKGQIKVREKGGLEKVSEQCEKEIQTLLNSNEFKKWQVEAELLRQVEALEQNLTRYTAKKGLRENHPLNGVRDDLIKFKDQMLAQKKEGKDIVTLDNLVKLQGKIEVLEKGEVSKDIPLSGIKTAFNAVYKFFTGEEYFKKATQKMAAEAEGKMLQFSKKSILDKIIPEVAKPAVDQKERSEKPHPH